MPGFLDKIASFMTRPIALSSSSRAESIGAATKATKNQIEHDYISDPPEPGRKPVTARFRDLPIVGSTSFDDVDSVRAALSQFELGQFWQSAQLVDAFGVDDRITGVVQTRLDALFGLPLEISGRRTGKKPTKIAARAQREWQSWFADAELKKLLKWALYLRVGVGELIWDTTDGSYWSPRFKAWDPRYLFWRWDTRTFWLVTMDGPVEVTPGDGHWIIYAPDGYARGWMSGYIRSLCLLFMIRRWAVRDWARYSEVHGLPIKKAKVPAGLPPEDKEAFLSDLETLGSEGLVRLAVDEQGRGFDLELLEAASNSHEGFRQLQEKCDECIAVDVLGQNLTTSVKGGGSYAAANVHDRIRLDRVEADSKSLGECLSEQALLPWAVYNFGDRELAPRVRWSTKIEEQRSVTAETWGKAGDALSKLAKARQTLKDGKRVGLNIDLEAVAATFRVPLVEGNPFVELPEPAPERPGAKPGEPEDPDEKNEQGEKPDDEDNDAGEE